MSIFVALLLGRYTDAGSIVTLETPQGLVEGTANATGGYSAFLALPYAAPPVKGNRFRPPQPATSWAGVHNGTSYGAACLQDPDYWPYTMGEDCLLANVWVPAISNTSISIAKLPVMVWIHGGANTQGAGSDPQFAGDLLCQEGVVVVNFNYRLGIFGYLALPSIRAESKNMTGGMNGLLDMIQALNWVQQNIHAYGGDPERVTIFGESAGANNICTLAVSPLTTTLFRRMILESGDCTTIWGPGAQQETIDLHEGYLVEMGIFDHSLKHLRSLDAAAINDKVDKHNKNFVPSIDGHVVDVAPKELWSNPGALSLPPDGAALIGGNSQDGLLTWPFRLPLAWGSPQYPTSEAEFKKVYMSYFHNKSFVNSLAEVYNASSNATMASILIGADLCVLCPGYGPEGMLNRIEAEGRNAYSYYFSANRAKHGVAVHASEVPSVFGRALPAPFLPALGDYFLPNFNQTISGAMRAFWSSFAKAGVPVFVHDNSDSDSDNGSSISIEWPMFNGSHQMFFDDQYLGAGIIDRHRTARCQVWHKFQKYHPGVISTTATTLAAMMLVPVA